MQRLDEKLNSTQEKQLELTTDIRDHGHGNKQRIDQLTSQITNFTSDFEIFDQLGLFIKSRVKNLKLHSKILELNHC